MSEPLNIKPICELRTNIKEISRLITEEHQSIIFTKNGYGCMVMVNLDSYMKYLEWKEKYENGAE